MGLRHAIIKWQWKTKQVSARHGGAIMEMHGPYMKTRILLPALMATNLEQILWRRYTVQDLLVFHLPLHHVTQILYKQTDRQTKRKLLITVLHISQIIQEMMKTRSVIFEIWSPLLLDQHGIYSFACHLGQVVVVLYFAAVEIQVNSAMPHLSSKMPIKVNELSSRGMYSRLGCDLMHTLKCHSVTYDNFKK